MSIVLPDSTIPSNPALLYSTWPAGTTVTANSSAAGYDAADILAATEDTGHRFAAFGVENSYIIDAGVAISADYLAVLGSPLQWQTLQVWGSNDGINYTVIGPLAGDVFADNPSGYLGATPTAAAAWVRFTPSTWRWWKIIFQFAPAHLEINHLALGTLAPWPYFEEDWDADNLTINGEQLMSAAGYYAGGVVQAALRHMALTPGAVTPGEYEVIAAFAAQVIRHQTGCFFVPQVNSATVYFGHLDDKKFAAPLQNGLRQVEPFTFITRAL